ncbi:hypothetical protein D0T12_13410 [Actinomadura spongiicola]|uniref:Uncharacterized protein n=1 Tax=Actinomadura spongiicola TaxID=2303421 RepID=A0A372GHI9_9ACTN|nr:hypothetical protein D0T12_13410 [Actinomadura spongiicola]
MNGPQPLRSGAYFRQVALGGGGRGRGVARQAVRGDPDLPVGAELRMFDVATAAVRSAARKARYAARSVD